MQNCQIELIHGSGVLVSLLFYASCFEEPTSDGPQLVRQLVTEVFTDDEILSGGTCTAMNLRRRRTNSMLDGRKVNAIKGVCVLMFWLFGSTLLFYVNKITLHCIWLVLG